MRRWATLLLAVLLLSGCRDERIIEKIGFIRTLAFDANEDTGSEDLKVTISIPKTNQTDTILYSTVARTGRQARQFFDRQNDRRLVSGQIRQVLFSVDAAKRDVWQEIQSLIRDPSIGLPTHLLVLEGDPERMLSAKYSQAPSPGEYIDNLIRTETRTKDIPETSLYIFARDYYDDGIEPIMSILKQTPNSLLVDGIALFSGGRYVGKIDADDKLYFSLLRGKVNSGDTFINFPAAGYSSEYASLHYFTSRRKLRIERSGSAEDGQGLRVRIQLHMRGSLLEYRGDLRLEKPKEQHELEAEIARYVREKCEETIGRMQQLKTDAIGIGQIVRNSMSYREWKKLDWAETFSQIRIEVDVTADIRNYGEIQ